MTLPAEREIEELARLAASAIEARATFGDGMIDRTIAAKANATLDAYRNAANPKRILALLSQISALKKEVSRLNELLDDSVPKDVFNAADNPVDEEKWLDKVRAAYSRGYTNGLNYGEARALTQLSQAEAERDEWKAKWLKEDERGDRIIEATIADLKEELELAAEARGIERAAKEGDKIASNTKDFNSDYRRGAGGAAAAARALKDTPNG